MGLFDQFRLDGKTAIVTGGASGIGRHWARTLVRRATFRLAVADVPVPFQGAAIGMITAGLMSLAFMGFAGLLLEMWQEEVATVNHAPDIDADDALPVRQAVTFETLGVGDTRIVEQQVDPTMFTDHRLGQALHGFGTADIHHVQQQIGT